MSLFFYWLIEGPRLSPRSIDGLGGTLSTKHCSDAGMNICTCLRCLFTRHNWLYFFGCCPFCSLSSYLIVPTISTSAINHHVQSHFRTLDGTYRCPSEGCKKTFKHMKDLTRHSKNHCLEAERIDCAAPGCDRKGNNGFHRMDKMKDHYRKMHARTPHLPPGTTRALLAPKPSSMDE